MTTRSANITSWILGSIAFLAIFIGIFIGSMSIWHQKIHERLAQWPIHQGLVINSGSYDISPQGSTESASVQFKDWSGIERVARVSLPDYYRKGMTLPVRVNRSGAAFVPQGIYDTEDPTKLLTRGFFPLFAILLGGFGDLVLCLIGGTCLCDRLKRLRPEQIHGRLGTR